MLAVAGPASGLEYEPEHGRGARGSVTVVGSSSTWLLPDRIAIELSVEARALTWTRGPDARNGALGPHRRRPTSRATADDIISVSICTSRTSGYTSCRGGPRDAAITEEPVPHPGDGRGPDRGAFADPALREPRIRRGERLGDTSFAVVS